MSGLKPVGSEKLPLQEKIERIKQIAGISNAPSNVTNYSNTHYSVKAQDGDVYAIIKENNQYFIKSGKDENNLSHIDGQLGSANRNETFSSYSTALKRLNFKMKSINEANNYGVIEEQKKVLKVDVPTPEPEGDNVEDMDMDLDMDLDMDAEGGGPGEEDMDMDMDMDLEGGEEDMDMDMELDVEGGDAGAEEEDGVKTIQKLTGKLGQKLRKADGKGELDSETIKYVLNSVISAVNLDNLEAEDREEIVEKFEETDSEYDDLDDMSDMEVSGEEEFDMGDDDMDMEMDMDMGDDDMDVELEENVPALAGMAGEALGGWAGEKVLEKTLRGMRKGGNKMEFSDDELASIFRTSNNEELSEDYDKVSNVINNYFKVSKEEKENNKQKRNNFLESKLTKARKITSILEHTETIEQETASRKFLSENDNIEVVGKNTKGSLVFNSKGVVTEISKKGLQS